MLITLQKITPNEKEILLNMSQFLLNDISEMNGIDLEEDGRYKGISDIADYYCMPNHISYFIQVDGKLAGLAIIRFDDGINYFRQFGILRKYRGQKIGKLACYMIFDMYPGKWSVSQFDFNKPAIEFWRKVITDYTNGRYEESRREDDQGPLQTFYAKESERP